MSLWHYRILTAKFDPDAYRYVVDAARAEGEAKAQAVRDLGLSTRGGGGSDEAALASVAGVISAPQKVEAFEASGDLATVREVIEAGELKATDLVRHEGEATWTLLGEHPEFYDLFEGHETATGGRTARWVFMAFGVAVLVGAAAIIW